MNRVFYLNSADGGGKWDHRPDQYGTSLIMTHPDVKEFCCIKGTQEGMSQQGGAAAIQDAINGNSVVYYMPNDTKAREQTTRIFNHWIDTVDEVNAEFLYEKAEQKSPGNDLNKKPFMDATLYSLGASPSNTSSITVQKGYIDEPDRIKQNIGGEGGIIGLLAGRFGSIPSGKLSVYGSPTTKHGRIWKYFSTFKHVFECYWPCPHEECGKMQTADWGGVKAEYGFKWDLVYEDDGITLDVEKTSETAHYICKHCKKRIEENEFRDQLYKCEYFSQLGLWFDVRASSGRGEFKEKDSDGNWRIVKAPSKAAARKTKDGIGLYSMSTWAEGARLWLEAVNYYNVTGDVEELLIPRVNTYRGTIWEHISQSEVKSDVVLSHRSDFYDNRKLPDSIDRLGMEVDFQKRFCKYMITGYAKNGKKTDIYAFICKPLQGRTADPSAEFWQTLSEIATDEYEREDGTMLRIGRVIADAGHEPDNVIKWCSEDPEHRIAVFGRPGSEGGLPRVMFDYSDEKTQWKVYTVEGEEYGAHGVPINPHKASSRAYARLDRKPGEPGCIKLASTDDFNQDFADEAVADKHSRKKAPNGDYYDHYEKASDSVQNEAHDLLKYAEIVLHILDKFGVVVPLEISGTAAQMPSPPQTNESFSLSDAY